LQIDAQPFACRTKRGDSSAIVCTAQTIALEGVATGGAQRNWSSYVAAVRFAEPLEDWQHGLLCDPQTSGGLLIAVGREAAPAVLGRLAARGFARAAVIGELSRGSPEVTVV
jgi:selenide, water dikinase